MWGLPLFLLHGLANQRQESGTSWFLSFLPIKVRKGIGGRIAVRIGSTCIWPGRGLQLRMGGPHPQKAQGSERARCEGEKARSVVGSGRPGPAAGENAF